MKVYKFGGASVKDAEGIRNIRKILEKDERPLIIVISAFGKSTNKLEELLNCYFYEKEELRDVFTELKTYHFSVIEQLFSKENPVYNEINLLFQLLWKKLREKPSGLFDYEYDQVVSFGEIFSTTIVSRYLSDSGIKNTWIDIRENLITDDTYREARIDWERSSVNVKKNFHFEGTQIYVTQGFIGGTHGKISTTLGREGSDYTAAVLANILDAEEVVIWKDVPGVMNADPKWMGNAEILREISYQEAIELAFFGAKIIHPKTLKPLHNKHIPLHVKSFDAPQESGTFIYDIEGEWQLPPVYILKQSQMLLSIVPKDLSFALEDSLSRVFSMFFNYRVKVNLLQNSATSISVCVDGKNTRIPALLKELSETYHVRFNENLELITIRHYDQESIEKIKSNRNVMIEQKTRRTVRFVLGD